MTITSTIPRVFTPGWSAASQTAPAESTVGTAWTSLPRDMLDGGELVLLAVKPSIWRPLFDSLPWLLTCIVLLAGVSRLSIPLWGIAPGTAMEAIVIFALARLAIALLHWVPAWYVLTNRRVLFVRGVRRPRISSMLLNDIRNTYLHTAITEHLTGIGTLTLVSKLDDQPMQVWRSIPNPEDVHAKIRRAIEDAIDQHDSLA